MQITTAAAPVLRCNNCGEPTASLHGVTGDLGTCCYTGTYAAADAMATKDARRSSETAARTDLTITCDRCHHEARYVRVPANPEAPAGYVCAHHAYPLAGLTRLP